MNRRAFLKLSALAPIAACVPLGAQAQEIDLSPDEIDFVWITDYYTGENYCAARASRFIPQFGERLTAMCRLSDAAENFSEGTRKAIVKHGLEKAMKMRIHERLYAI